ncbi:MAG: GlsB/YeaQ/YmgE family stress response membrane protein [Actinomycetota bacterium]|nr:GlsB/YeaQ/YmgE family stress response membrane protein [Actinomycetota bacterium]
MTLGEILLLLVDGLVIGALARLAVPGPDPMPLWATLVFGLAGGFLGGGFGLALAGWLGAILLSIVVAALLIIGYRRFVQKRPITGPRAKLPPS